VLDLFTARTRAVMRIMTCVCTRAIRSEKALQAVLLNLHLSVQGGRPSGDAELTKGKE
jgi:hypothetical protein